MTLNFRETAGKAFVDIPNSSPKFSLEIPKVGISNRPVVLNLRDPLTGKPASMAGQVRVSCSLRPEKRGLHMSRVEEAVDELRSSSLSPRDFAGELARLVKNTQDQKSCFAELDVQHEHRIEKNVSGKSSIELLTFHSACHLNNDEALIESGVSVPFMNACPCTQRWAMRDFYNLLQDKGCSPEQAEELVRSAPLQAHTNGGTATLKIASAEISHQQIYNILTESVPVIREMLKGIDEHTFVTLTHKQGQFCEDNARAIAVNTVKHIENLVPHNTRIKIHVEVNESVHFHNLWAAFDCELKDLFI